jgi:hypothetical protein
MQYRCHYSISFEQTVASDYLIKGEWNETVVDYFVVHPVPKYAWSFRTGRDSKREPPQVWR